MQKPDRRERLTKRVQFLMSPSELEEIDNWGIDHRIRTRGETIRRLCRAALAETKKPTAVPALEKRTAAGPDTHDRSE